MIKDRGDAKERGRGGVRGAVMNGGENAGGGRGSGWEDAREKKEESKQLRDESTVRCNLSLRGENVGGEVTVML